MLQVPPERPSPSPAEQCAHQVEAARRAVQEQHEAEYQRAVISIKESVRAVEGPDIRETLQEQIRQWLIECRWDTPSLRLRRLLHHLIFPLFHSSSSPSTSLSVCYNFTGI